MDSWRYTKPNKHKANTLIELADNLLERLETTNKAQYSTSTFLDYYTIIHHLMEAIASLDGIKFFGKGAHFNLIDYVSSKYKIDCKDFLQEFRDRRNNVIYEGKKVGPQFLRNEDYIKEIIKQLKTIIKNQ